MQFNCYECHKPHKSSRPDWGNCLSCHKNIMSVGKHKTHIQDWRHEMQGLPQAPCLDNIE